MALGRGESPAQARSAIHQVIEGVPASRAVYDVAQRLEVEMPICRAISTGTMAPLAS